MQCPACRDTPLTMSERQGIEIDYCSKCRGVWLDRGELDKIIERSARVETSRAPQDTGERYRDRDDDDHRHGHYKKRKSWLMEIFD